LGRFPLPVEVIPFGYEQLMEKFEALGYQPVLRTNETSAVVKTDSNNYILDLHLGKINDPIKLATILDSTVGVVEHGLFLNVVDEVVVGNSDGVSVLKR
jgi:ribose 5-phosphate isomerase A